MNSLRQLSVIIFSAVTALMVSTAVLLLTPGQVFERLLFAGLLFPLLTPVFVLLLQWYDNPKSALVSVSAVFGLCVLTIIIKAPIH